MIPEAYAGKRSGKADVARIRAGRGLAEPGGGEGVLLRGCQPEFGLFDTGRDTD